MFLTIFSVGHVVIVLAVILLLFGGKKIPELMKGLGQGIKEFKDSSKGDEKQSDVKENPVDSNLEQK